MSHVLSGRLTPCGPVVNEAAAARSLAVLDEAAAAGGWSATLDQARAALAPVLAASPYLAGLMRRRPERLRLILQSDPDARLAELLRETEALDGPASEVRDPLRRLKGDLHLLTALSDLGGVWDLDSVTGALSHFADASVKTGLAAVAREQRDLGRLKADPDGPGGPVPGLFALAMGKHGAFELNYSSDIDISLFFDPERLGPELAENQEVQRFADRVAHGLAGVLSERTAEGYVFRVDLRLRPDPSSTPPAVGTPMALAYYESVGQNWERAAFIKARAVGGDAEAAAEFVDALRPFVWRRSLDYPAILDIQSIKKQIHVHKAGHGLLAAGANLKLGQGGIREIEFYAQTQQLILGGRDPGLRAPRTVDALRALATAGHLPDEVAQALCAAYRRLRDLEHRVQMLDDEQTHILPADAERRGAVAALAGASDLTAFDADVEALLTSVNTRYGELFEDGEDLSSPWGSLVFTGVENDPETLATLARMGFSQPAGVADTIRSWHHGRIPATRTAKGRELFTRLAPRLLTALAETGAPDDAFRRFAVFFSSLLTGVQVQALFLNQPKLFELVVSVMAFAPRLGRMLGRRPAALDSMMDPRFLMDLDAESGLIEQIRAEADGARDFESALDAVRRIHREQSFRIGMHLVTGRAAPDAAGRALTAMADAAIGSLAPAALKETERMGGRLSGGAVAVVALGKAGSREMTAGSDLDLMTLYEAPPEASSAKKGWSADVFFVRFTQRLISALSAHTAEGGLYEVDMRLRPTGSKGPVSVRLAAFSDYYASEAETWEFMVLTRARVVWASRATFGREVERMLEATLRRPRPGIDVAGDIRRMRGLMDRERRPSGFWDLKLSQGGQVDAEFVAQYRQLTAAARGEPLTVSTLGALKDDPVMAEAWALQQGLAQMLNSALDGDLNPDNEPGGFQARLAEAVRSPDFESLKARLAEVRARARSAFEAALPAAATESAPVVVELPDRDT